MASLFVRNVVTRQLPRQVQSISAFGLRPNAYHEVATKAFAQRYFSGDNKDDNNKDGEKKEATSYPEMVADSLPDAKADYDVQDIMKSFDDTSYVETVEHHDFSQMTNEELLDTSTIPGWELIHSPPKDKKSIPRGALVGTVVSTKMSKTVNVAVDRYRVHKKYRKRIRYTKKFMAHDEAEVASSGDLVMIAPCQRISKHKHFMLREIIRAKGQL